MKEVFRLEIPYREAFSLKQLTFGSGGRSVAVVAGLHGTELTGVHALNLVARALAMARCRGQVSLIPVVNRYGVEQSTKRWPFDDRDINQAFPGDPDGSPVQRIAHAVLEATKAEVCLDIHSGSPVVRELPQVRAPLAGAEVELARAMQLPMVWRRAGDRLEATGLVGAWRETGCHSLHVVGGRGSTLDVGHAREIANGILRVLEHMDIIGSMTDPATTVIDTTRAGVDYHYSSVGGFWVPEVACGDRVSPGQFLGAVTEIVGGDRMEEVRANRSGVVMSMRCYPVVHARELLVRVAETRS
jgi:uncharacterized protein